VSDQGTRGHLPDECVIDAVVEVALRQSGSNDVDCLLKVLEGLVVVQRYLGLDS